MKRHVRSQANGRTRREGRSARTKPRARLVAFDRDISVADLCKRKFYLPPLFLDASSACLSTQSSSASAERQFGDAGYQEGFRRQHGESSVIEMLLMIRSFVHSRIANASRQKGFLSSRAQDAKEFGLRKRLRATLNAHYSRRLITKLETEYCLPLLTND